jgi:alpha-tubulin suppressor-like RCC1 family protein
VQIGGDENWAVVSAGGAHSLGIKADGSLWAWGNNTEGQLGDGTLVNRLLPVQIGTARNWVRVAAGPWHTFAVRADGTLWGWGRNAEGQLGNGSSVSPVSAPVVMP